MRLPGTDDFGSGSTSAGATSWFSFASDRAEARRARSAAEPPPPAEAADGPPGTFALIAAASAAHVNSTFAGVAHAAARRVEPT
ncbi:MAG: hypothetical protein R2713_08125 [Ilumatobacteraceae bacterium]